MKFLFFVSLLLVATDAKLSEQEQHCVDFAFENKTLVSPDDINFCKKFFKDQKALFRAEFDGEFTCADDRKDACDSVNRIKDCFMKNFDNHRFGDLYVTGLISHLHRKANESEVEDEFINDSYHSALIRSKKIVKTVVRYSEAACVSNTTKQTNLQRLINKSKRLFVEEIACLRRYAFEKNIIDPADYGFDVSNLTSFDCELAFEILDKKMTAVIPNKPIAFLGVNDPAISDCENRPEFARMFNEALLKIRVMSTFDLSSEQQIKIVDVMMVTARSQSTYFLECFKSYCADHCKEY